MAIVLNDNLNTFSPKPLDERYGPWATTILANAGILVAQRHIGLTVGITTGSTIAEYWYASGVTDNDLVLKLGGASNNISFAYGQTLFVDAVNGNDASAQIGNLTKPFQSINAAIDAAANATTLSLTSFTIHVFKGEYEEVESTIGSGYNITLYFEPGVSVTVTTSSNQPWIDLADSTLTLVGGGRSNTYVLSNSGVIRMSGDPNSNPILNVENISLLSTAGSSGNGENNYGHYVIKNVNGQLKIDSSIVSMVTKTANMQKVILSSGGTISVKSSLLSFDNEDTTTKYPSVSNAATASWIIFDADAVDMQGRIKLHQTTLSSKGKGGGFIYTKPTGSDGSILLDNVYFYTDDLTTTIYTLFNDSGSLRDKCHVNSMCMSGGYEPYGISNNMSWTIFPVGLPVSLLQSRVNTAQPY